MRRAPLAFIGLSQVRESAVFSGIPLTERLTERTCGVWVINLDTAETIAFLKFEDAVQEIFAVNVLAGVILVDLQQWQAGIEQLEQVIAERSDHEQAHNSLGVAYLNLGNPDQARWHFERAVTLNPRFEIPRKNLQALQTFE